MKLDWDKIREAVECDMDERFITVLQELVRQLNLQRKEDLATLRNHVHDHLAPLDSAGAQKAVTQEAHFLKQETCDCDGRKFLEKLGYLKRFSKYWLLYNPETQIWDTPTHCPSCLKELP